MYRVMRQRLPTHNSPLSPRRVPALLRQPRQRYVIVNQRHVTGTGRVAAGQRDLFEALRYSPLTADAPPWRRCGHRTDGRSASYARNCGTWGWRSFVRETTPKVLARINAQTAAIQGQIADQVALLVRRQPSPITNALMAAVNEVADAASSERFAFARRVPVRIYWLLLVLTLTGMAVLGYRIGVKGSTTRLLALVLATVWALVIVDIVDLGSPRIGDVRPDVTAYEWTLQEMAHGAPATQLPAKIEDRK